MPRLRASLNVRLSKLANESNVSKDGMIADLRSLCAREGFDEVALHIDDGVSGSVRDRPGLVNWLDDGREDRADVLLAWHVDRMTREGLPVAAAILDVVEGQDPVTGKAAHKPVRLMDYHGLDSRDGESFRLRFVLQAEMARNELQRTKGRARARDRRLREQHRWGGGQVPTGYRPVPREGGGWVLAVEETEAAALREAAERVISGESLWGVTRWMNRDGVPPRRGEQWTTRSLAKCLGSNHLLGWITLGGEPLRDEDGKAVEAFPHVLDLPTAQSVRAALVSKPRDTPRGRRPARLLSRLVLCAGCFAPMTVSHLSSGRVDYRCVKQSTGRTCPRPVVMAADGLEEFVESEYLAAVGAYPQIKPVAQVHDDGKLALVEDAIAATLRELGAAATAEALTRLQTLQTERDHLSSLPKVAEVVMVPTGKTQGEAWAAGDVHDRRALLHDAIEVLAVGPGTPGRRGFDPSRVTLIWREGILDPED
ncbi:recombinase family protein [Micromonospora chokoriensis]